MATLVLTVLGDDRPGLVSALSAAVNAQGASWERSQMARLAGKFAGILLVAVSDERVEELLAGLDAVRALGLQVTVTTSDEPAEEEAVRLRLTLLGADRPGIVAEVSAALAARRVGIEELATAVREAPMSGGMLFEATAALSAPPAAALEDLRAVLEELADELMVEIELTDG